MFGMVPFFLSYFFFIKNLKNLMNKFVKGLTAACGSWYCNWDYFRIFLQKYLKLNAVDRSISFLNLIFYDIAE